MTAPVLPAPPTRNARDERSQHVVLRGVSWETYEALLNELDGQSLRLTYDQGMLEIMSPSLRHANVGKVIARLVEAMTLELSVPLVGLSNATWRRKSLQKGCEADECYYVQHAHWAAGKDAIDLEVDPPPDLVIEMDITSSSLDKQSIYAAIGVPELWRYENDALTIAVRDPSGTYRTAAKSLALPMLPPEVVVRFVGMRRGGSTDTEIVRAFLEWVRATLPGR